MTQRAQARGRRQEYLRQKRWKRDFPRGLSISDIDDDVHFSGCHMKSDCHCKSDCHMKSECQAKSDRQVKFDDKAGSHQIRFVSFFQ